MILSNLLVQTTLKCSTVVTFLVLCFSIVSSQPVDSSQTIKSLASDSISSVTTDSLSDSTSDTSQTKALITDTSSSSNTTPDTTTTDLKSADQDSSTDTTRDLNGIYLGVKGGWTIGSFQLIDLWQESLPDSLSHLGLSDTSFSIRDSASTPGYIDTSKLKFVLKEKPGEYTISIPVALFLSKITDSRMQSLSIGFAYIGKTQKTIVTGLIDSLSSPINIKHHLNNFTFSIEGTTSIPLMERYFQVDGVDKTYFTFGIGLGSVITKVYNDISFDGRSLRVDSVMTAMKEHLESKKAFATAATLRAGITTIRSMSDNSNLEFGIHYTFGRYDYFGASLKRLKKEWISPGTVDKIKPLSFITNRIELSVALAKKLTKNEKKK